MKISLRAVLFACLVSALLMLQSAHAAPFVSSHGYSLTPAAGWRVNHSGMMNTDVVVLAPPVNKFAPNLNVVLSLAPAGQTLEAGQKQVAIMYPRVFTDFKMLSSTIGNLGGLKALDLFGTYRQGTYRLRLRQAFVLHAGHYYVFTCTSPEASHVQYDAAFTQMLESVHWSK